jgi:O-antigen/teichoic acid export membrane protein
MWAVVLLLAKLGTAEMVGIVVLARAICAPLTGLANLGLRGVLITDVRGDYAFRDYLGLRLAGSGLAAVAVVGTILIGGYPSQVAWIILVVFAGKAFESISDIFHGLLQQQERMDRIGLALIIRGPLGLALLVVGLCATGSLVWGMLGFALAAAITFLMWDLPSVAGILVHSRTTARCDVTLTPRFHPRTMASLAWISFPLGMVFVLIALGNSIPRYVIDSVLGREQLGIYAAIAYPAMMATMVVASMGQAACPRLAKYHAAGNKSAYYRLLAKMLVLVFGLGVVGVVIAAIFARPILHFLYGPQYAAHWSLAVWIMVAATFRYLTRPLAKAVDATRRFKTSMMVRAAGVLLMTVVLLLGVRAYGLIGAPLATLASSVFLVFVYSVTIVWLIQRPGPRSENCYGAHAAY